MKIVGGKNKMSETEKECCEHKREIEELKKLIEEKDTKFEEQKNQMLRLMADFDNFKKRTVTEKEDIICFSNETLILALLPILDNFDRAFVHAAETKDSAANDELLKGFALIKKQLEDILNKVGLSKIDALGKKFDPVYHEAVLTRDTQDQPEGLVIEEMQKGYMLKEKVIRPAMAIVSKKGEAKDE
ncbi:MAG: nucleotide exchange factor GrpE [Candidatus Margulisiibacteriota bacterium]